MNIEQSFLKERPVNEKEVQNLKFDLPKVTSAVQRKDIFQTGVIDPASKEPKMFGHEISGIYPVTWTFRTN